MPKKDIFVDEVLLYFGLEAACRSKENDIIDEAHSYRGVVVVTRRLREDATIDEDLSYLELEATCRMVLLSLLPRIRGCCRSKEAATIASALSYLGLEAAAEGRRTLPLLVLSLTSD